MNNIGREIIKTEYPVITRENVSEVLRKAMVVHERNRASIKFLLDYEKGLQPLQREKTYRKDIDLVDIDNVANEISEFKRGFHWGNPITLIQNGNNVDKTEAIGILNQMYSADDNHNKTQEIGRYVEITGLAYEYIDLNQDYTEGDSYFTTTPLNPLTSFCVYSSYYTDKRKMMGVSYYESENGDKHFTCITRDRVFNLTNYDHLITSDQKNPFGIINIVEWKRDYDGMGCFERQIQDMDILNIEISDFANDVDQNTQAIWHGNDIEFPVDENGNVVKPKKNEWLLTYTSQNGKTPQVNPLAVSYDYSGMLNNILAKRNLILQRAAVPQRNDNSGGSTGIAMSDATGWSSAEMVASKQQPLQEKSKMEEVKVVLAVLKKSPLLEVDSPLNDLVWSDMQPNIKRQKTYEMTTKINAFATGVSHGVSGKDMLEVINLFDDVNEVWEHSKEKIELYQKSVFDKSTDNNAEGGEGETKPNADRNSQDMSDQISNSPMIDSHRTEGN